MEEGGEGGGSGIFVAVVVVDDIVGTGTFKGMDMLEFAILKTGGGGKTPSGMSKPIPEPPPNFGSFG